MSEGARPLKATKKERNPEETKRRILDAAELEFAKKGFDGAKLRDVASAAEVHHALLHHYFGDKEGLFRAVVERGVTAITTGAYEIMSTTTDFVELVRRFMSFIIDYTANHPNLISILHFAALSPNSPSYAMCEELSERILVPVMTATRDMIAAAQAQGRVRSELDPSRVVSIAMGAASFIFHEKQFFGAFFGRDICEPDMIAAHKDAVTQFVLNGLLP